MRAQTVGRHLEPPSSPNERSLSPSWPSFFPPPAAARLARIEEPSTHHGFPADPPFGVRSKLELLMDAIQQPLALEAAEPTLHRRRLWALLLRHVAPPRADAKHPEDPVPDGPMILPGGTRVSCRSSGTDRESTPAALTREFVPSHPCALLLSHRVLSGFYAAIPARALLGQSLVTALRRRRSVCPAHPPR